MKCFSLLVTDSATAVVAVAQGHVRGRSRPPSAHLGYQPVLLQLRGGATGCPVGSHVLPAGDPNLRPSSDKPGAVLRAVVKKTVDLFCSTWWW